MTKIFKIFIAVILITNVFYFLILFEIADGAASVNYKSKYLPAGIADKDPGKFVGNIYLYAIGIAGVVAVGVIIYGAIRWVVSGGNPAGVSEAKTWITGALGGLILLLGAYLILKTINPRLVNLQETQKEIESMVGKQKIPQSSETPGVVGTPYGNVRTAEEMIEDAKSGMSN